MPSHREHTASTNKYIFARKMRAQPMDLLDVKNSTMESGRLALLKAGSAQSTSLVLAWEEASGLTGTNQ